MPQHLTIPYKLESTNPDFHMKENALLICVHHLVFGSAPHSCIIQILDHINSIEMTYWMPGAQAASSYLFHPWLLLFSQSLVLSRESPFMPLLLFSLKCGSVSQGLRFQFFVQLRFYSPPPHSVIPQIFFQLSSDPTQSWVFWTPKTSAQAEVNLICICKTKGLCSPSCPLTFPAIEGFAKHLFASHF